MARHAVLVPAEVAMAYTADRQWHVLAAPPAWWLEEQEAGAEPASPPAPALRLVPALPPTTTSCRPGSGPCKRRHEHSTPRRASVAS